MPRIHDSKRLVPMRTDKVVQVIEENMLEEGRVKVEPGARVESAALRHLEHQVFDAASGIPYTLCSLDWVKKLFRLGNQRCDLVLVCGASDMLNQIIVNPLNEHTDGDPGRTLNIRI